MTPTGSNARRVRLIFGALLLVLLLASLDQTIVSTALPTIVGELGGISKLSWVVTAYLLASTVVGPLYGKLGDLYGRKGLLQGAIVVFLVGSALCGLSQNMTELIVFRAIQGLGGGGLIVLTVAVVGDIIPPRDRGRYQGFFGAVFGLSTVVGPLLGGFFVDNLSWRWIFYVNLPIGLIALAVISVAFESRTDKTEHSIDFLGAALLAGGLSAIVLYTSLGGTTYAWSSPPMLALVAAGVVLLVAFVFAELHAAEPILPLELFRNRVFRVSGAVAFIVGLALFGAVTFVPLYLQNVKGHSPTVSGLLLTPMMAGILVTSIGSGQLISRFGRYKPFPIAGTAIMAVGLFLLSRLHVGTPTLVGGAYLLVLGLGLGPRAAGARAGRPERGRLRVPRRRKLGLDALPSDRRLDRGCPLRRDLRQPARARAGRDGPERRSASEHAQPRGAAGPSTCPARRLRHRHHGGPATRLPRRRRNRGARIRSRLVPPRGAAQGDRPSP